jgi:hypothetical protein
MCAVQNTNDVLYFDKRLNPLRDRQILKAQTLLIRLQTKEPNLWLNCCATVVKLLDKNALTHLVHPLYCHKIQKNDPLEVDDI